MTHTAEIEIQLKEKRAPASACVFRDTTIAGFTDGQDAANSRFRIVAYSGQIIKNHWYWGNLAFDLKGIQFDKKKTPILEEHERNVRIGYTTMQDIAEEVVAEGKFLSSEPAQKIRKDMVEGFPMQASVFNVPAIVERVEQGSSVMVNGQKMDGPGTVFRKSTIYEVSLCCLGADNQTSGEVFEKDREIKFDFIEGDQQMAETKTELTAEKFAAENPNLLAQTKTAAKEEGKKEAMLLVAKFAEQFGKDPAFCLEQLKAGASIEQATAAYAAKLEKENAALKEAAKTAIQPPAAATKPVDPAVQKFADDAADKNNQTKPAADTEEGWKAEFAASKDLQKEFGGKVEDYVAYKKAEKEGRIKNA